MSSDIQLFDHPEFGSVRVIMLDGEPWFIAKDVCDCIKVGNVSDALSGLDDDEKGVVLNDTLGGAQGMLAVTEAGFYALILRSRKRSQNNEIGRRIRAFQRWVTHDVLPSIRKTGFYSSGGVTVPALGSPADIARAWADMYEAKLAAEKQAQLAIEARDDAIATKGRIVAGRDQRLMQQRHDDIRTIRRKDERNGRLESMYAEQGIELGAERMRADRAENDLGIGKTYKCAANIGWFKDYFDYKNCVAEKINGQAGRQLRILSDEMGYGYRVVPGHKYDTKAYHVDVIAAFRLRLDQNPKLMEKWRKHD